MRLAAQRSGLYGVAIGAALALAGCQPGEPPAAGGPPPPPVGVVKVEPRPTVITSELPGRLEPTRIAEVRARVAGIVLQRAFREGSDVKAGQLLFRIDPAPLQADLAAAEAALARSEASLALARVQANRYAALVKSSAISQQEYDNATAAQKLGEAEVAAQRAARARARLNPGYATVAAPISGRIGRALVTEGALVGQDESTPMARIQQLDPVYADFTQPVSQLARLRKAFASGQLERADEGGAKVALVLEDGSQYAHPGRMLFSDVTVDPDTGQVTLRAQFPNPDRLLLPGMYVRVRLEQGVEQQAIRIPQQAVQRSPDGGGSVLVVGADNKPVPRAVVTDGTVGDEYIVRDGLAAGETVVVDGFQKIRPGATVQPVPWSKEPAAAEPRS
ncbi:MAG: efflux RND transporter periplasmic adaptor subunit [Burkholderiaceae bacterium]|nr:efflux RND transporter periplasmic adaptor subunit [Burkholderiaceae bacterium]